MRRRLVATLTASALAIGIVAAPVAAAKPADNSIVDVALAVNAESGEFDILIAALKAADPSILAALDGKGQYTVFAPTDAAFLNLLDILDTTPAELLGNTALLNRVLTYHVARGERDSTDVLGSSRIRTLNGAFIRQSGGELVDRSSATPNAGFVATDVQASNGIIHVIDQVLVP